MNKDNLIDNHLMHLSKVNSENSFTYLVDYYLRKDIRNYIDVISDIILQSKVPVNLFNHAMRRFYTEAVAENNYLPYQLLVNSSKISDKMDKKFILELYQSALEFLRNGENLNEVEKKLYEILDNSILKEMNDC